MQANHKELILTFKEVLSIEAALQQKIITAVDAKDISALRNRKNKFTKKIINGVINQIFGAYGKITLHMIIQRKDLVKHMTFDVDAPINTIFSDVE